MAHCNTERTKMRLLGSRSLKRNQRDDTLRYTMNLHRIRAVMKISGRAVLAEKVGSVELEPAADARFELRCFGIAADGPQRAQVVAGMEVVDPSL